MTPLPGSIVSWGGGPQAPVIAFTVLVHTFAGEKQEDMGRVNKGIFVEQNGMEVENQQIKNQNDVPVGCTNNPQW